MAKIVLYSIKTMLKAVASIVYEDSKVWYEKLYGIND